MRATKIRRPGPFAWLFALLICSSISTAGLVQAQDAAPTGAPSGTVFSTANDAPAMSDSAAAGRTATNSAPGQTNAQPAAAPPTDRDVSERTVFLNILHDQKDLWLFPTKLSHENHWLPAIVVVGVTAGVMTADAHDAPYFRQTTTFNGFNRVFAGSITNSEILIAPASFYLVGLFDKDAYARKTGLLAAEALADVTVLSVVMKGATRRLRPSDIAPYGDFSDTFFKKNTSPFSGSFPSGHAISAFAVATVIASRYGKRHRWVPFLAYGTAAVIGFSRVTTQAHFPSDVFLGAALGFAVAQFDVLRAPGYGPVHYLQPASHAWPSVLLE
jgi:membrane-associated phospholipid phosphatase